MDLETFIAETLRQIVKGIKIAQEHEDCKGGKINPFRPSGGEVKQIDFDVAVTATEGSEKKGGIGVFTGVFGVGGQANANTANSTVSRIKFSVPIIFPMK